MATISRTLAKAGLTRGFEHIVITSTRSSLSWAFVGHHRSGSCPATQFGAPSRCSTRLPERVPSWETL